MKNLQAFIIGLLAILIFGSATANAATWTVTKSTNGNDNVCDADCSLREAVFNADSGDTVNFSPNLVGQTFALGGSEIIISESITIDGNLDGVNAALISGGNASRIFLIQTGGGLNLKNAVLTQGNGAGSFKTGFGGAIFAKENSSLSLERVAIRNNSANTVAGAIQTEKTNVHILNSSITGNRATACVAMSLSLGNVRMANVTISGNFDSMPDDLSKLGAVCLISDNTIIRNSTISNNDGTRSAILMSQANNESASTLNLGNTIVAGNEFAAGGDVESYVGSNTVTSAGGNLVGSTFNLPAGIFAQPSDIMNVNPLLGPTNANLGGHPVQYQPLQAGSPARNGGLNANAVDPLTNTPLVTDARGAGYARKINTIVDKGAYEDASGDTLLTVTKNENLNDFVCDVDCSLRDAIHQASLNPGTDTITFAPNVFGNIGAGGSGEMLIQNQNVNIVGYPTLNANTLVMTGFNGSRLLRLNNATVNISGLTLANGSAGASFGGAILSENDSHLTLDKAIVRNCFANAYGAIYLNGGTARIINSTINNNSANIGLAIGVSGTLFMANTTISGNFDANGGSGIGAIYVTGTANIRNSTIAFNNAGNGTGGGIFADGTLNIANSIVSNNAALNSPDIHRSSGTITSLGGNLIQNANGFPAGTFSQANDAVNADPMLAALADNGGNVTTHLLLPNSPAINSGINANAVDPFDDSILVMDARGSGYNRISGGAADKGAFEVLSPTAASVSVSGRVTNGKRGVARARVTMVDQNGATRIALTNSFGYFRFEEVESGATYVFNVTAKNYIFMTRVVTVAEQIDELNFAAETSW